MVGRLNRVALRDVWVKGITMNIRRFYFVTYLVFWMGLPSVHAQQVRYPRGHKKNDHVYYSVKLVSGHYEIVYGFKDHKGQMQEFHLRYPEKHTAEMIDRFGIPQSMLGRYAATPEVIQERKRALKSGLFMLRGKTIVVDLDAVVHYYASFCEPIARQIAQALDKYGTDSRRERIEMAIKFVQDIPYGVPDMGDSNRHFGGFITPPQVLLSGYGDCDSKSVLFVCILSYLVDPSGIAFLQQPEHLLTAIEATPGPGQIYIDLDDGRYVLSETAGPGRPPFGEKGEYYSQERYTVEKLDFRGDYQPLPYGSRRNIWEGYDPLTIDTRGRPNDGLGECLKKVNDKRQIIKSVGLAPKGGWVVLYGQNGYATNGVPQETVQRLRRLHNQRSVLKHIAFTNSGGWVILHDGSYSARNIPASAAQKLSALAKRGRSLESITFTNDDGWVIVHDDGCESYGIPQSAAQKIADVLQGKRRVKSVAFTNDNGWIVVYERGYYGFGMPESAEGEIPRLFDKYHDLDAVFFTGNDGYIILLGERGYAYEF